MPTRTRPPVSIGALVALASIGLATASRAQQGWVTHTIENELIVGTPDQPVGYAFDCPLEVFEFGPSVWIDATIYEPSRASELNIELEHESGFVLSFDGSDSNPYDLGPADVDLGFADEPGTWQTGITVDIFGQLPSIEGAWTVWVYDEHDSLVGPEGTLTMTVTFWAPAPGTSALLLGAIGASCRRRSATKAPA